MTKKRVGILLLVLVLSAIAVFPAFAGGRGSGPVIFVTSQGLYYDSIVLTDLPPHGPFQQLLGTPPDLYTEFGPGDPGYVGGRWWVDANGSGEMDSGDAFFSCPLLGPGRESP
jgi:hypothetical protein